MIRGHRRAELIAACAHHWHVVDTGWVCCCCPERVKASQCAPEPGAAVCTAGPVPDSFTAWLAPARPVAAGHRQGRRNYRRRSTA